MNGRSETPCTLSGGAAGAEVEGSGRSGQRLLEGGACCARTHSTARGPLTRPRSAQGARFLGALFFCLFSTSALASPSAELGVAAGAALVSPGNLSVGPALRVDVAVQLHERVSVAVFALGSTHRGAGNELGGDLHSLTPAAAVRINALGFSDALDARRAWVYARAGLGWTMLWPAGRFADGGLFLFAALGAEYVAHLKGFALGLEVAPAWYPTRGAFAGSVMPYLRFTF